MKWYIILYHLPFVSSHLFFSSVDIILFLPLFLCRQVMCYVLRHQAPFIAPDILTNMFVGWCDEWFRCVKHRCRNTQMNNKLRTYMPFGVEWLCVNHVADSGWAFSCVLQFAFVCLEELHCVGSWAMQYKNWELLLLLLLLLICELGASNYK